VLRAVVQDDIRAVGWRGQARHRGDHGKPLALFPSKCSEGRGILIHRSVDSSIESTAVVPDYNGWDMIKWTSRVLATTSKMSLSEFII
jgi:hypothetical protein